MLVVSSHTPQFASSHAHSFLSCHISTCTFLAQVWDACSDARIVFNRHSLQQDSSPVLDELPDDARSDIIAYSYHGDAMATEDSLMGYVVENRAILSALNEAVENCSNIMVQRGAKIENIKSDGSQVGMY